MRKLVLTLTTILFLCINGFSQNTIDPVLQEVMNKKGDELISVNIIFKAQINPESLQEKITRVSDKKIKRDILVDELKHFSEKEQSDVMSISHSLAMMR